MKYILANWKMQLSVRESVALARAVMGIMRGERVLPQVVIFPSFTVLNDVRKVMARSRVKLGAQNCAPDKKGAYTGEVSASMLQDVGCEFALIGHSERRTIFGETDELIAKRYWSAFDSKISPVLCVGENKFELQADNAQGFVSDQIMAIFDNREITQRKDIFIAYEPVWAIGSDHSATIAQAVLMHSFIRELVVKITGLSKSRVHILYGGSVDSDNVYGFLREQEIDGILVGGASLKIRDFEKIVASAADVIKAQEM
jgi:triosephosphate isomerase